MRTHFCGLVDETLIGQTVTLAGWTDVARNQGGVCFIDLRDHEGIVQVTVEADNAEVFAVAASLGYEDVLQVEGVVRARHAVNDKIATGKVEVIATAITVLNKAAPLPFHAHENPGEDTRLKYRYLDLRRAQALPHQPPAPHPRAPSPPTPRVGPPSWTPPIRRRPPGCHLRLPPSRVRPVRPRRRERAPAPRTGAPTEPTVRRSRSTPGAPAPHRAPPGLRWACWSPWCSSPR